MIPSAHGVTLLRERLFAFTIEKECMSFEEALGMKVRLARMLFLSAVLAAASQGCAACRPDAPATGAVSSFGSCDACTAAAQLPRGRLAPTPSGPLAPGAVPSGGEPPTAPRDPRARLLVPETPPEGQGGSTGLVPGSSERGRLPGQCPAGEGAPA